MRSRSRHWPGEQVVHFELIDPAARKVCVAGSFNDWTPEKGAMMRVAEGTWVIDLILKRGTYEYRLVVDGRWTSDPNSDHSVLNPFGERNSLVTVP